MCRMFFYFIFIYLNQYLSRSIQFNIASLNGITLTCGLKRHNWNEFYMYLMHARLIVCSLYWLTRFKVLTIHVLLMKNSENHEHLKFWRNFDCVLANHNKVQDNKQNSKPQTNYHCCLQLSYPMPYWLISRNTITFHKYFWWSRFCEFHSKTHKRLIIMSEKVTFLSKLHCGNDPSLAWLKDQCIKEIYMYKITCRTHMPYVLPRILCVSA